MDTEIKKYMDFETALGRLGGKVSLYIRLLQSFLDSDYCTKLEEAFLSGNKENFNTLAHSVKGVSSNLSLQEIYSYCVKFESNIQNGVDSAEDMAAFKLIYEKTAKIAADFIAERNE